VIINSALICKFNIVIHEVCRYITHGPRAWIAPWLKLNQTIQLPTILLAVFLFTPVTSTYADTTSHQSPQKVQAGVSGYRVPVLIKNPSQKLLIDTTLAITSTSGPVAKVELQGLRSFDIAAGQTHTAILSFDVEEDAQDGSLASIRLKASSADYQFDEPAPLVELIIEALEDHIEPDTTSSAANTGQTSGDQRKLDLYFVLRIEGSGYIPHWGSGSWFTSGFYEIWFRVSYDNSVEEKLTAYVDAWHSKTHPSCESRDGWQVLGPRKTPIIWKTGPKVTVMDKGPFTLADGSEKSWVTLEKSDWPRTDSKLTVSDFRGALCG
jgi:hypothetical protein